jgi:hypothetical protein
VLVKNKLCMECTIIMRLISWNHSRGSEMLHSFHCPGPSVTLPVQGFVSVSKRVEMWKERLQVDLKSMGNLRSA